MNPTNLMKRLIIMTDNHKRRVKKTERDSRENKFNNKVYNHHSHPNSKYNLESK